MHPQIIFRTSIARRAAVVLAAALATSSVLADLSQPGPFLAGWRTVSVTRPDNTTFSARLHYPALANGQNSTFDPSGAPYPALSFGHGFLQTVGQYQSTCAHLATHAYFVIASESEGGLAPNHQSFANDLRHTLTWLEQQNANPASPYYQDVDVAAFGLTGHSMGGGASILAAAVDPRIRVVAPLAAAETSPSAISAAAGVSVPLFLVSGDDDSITPIAGHTQPMYNAARAPKQLPAILGGFHCGFVDSGFLFCDSGDLTRSQQLAITRRLLTRIFNLYLKGDHEVWPEVWGPLLSLDPNVVTMAQSGVSVGLSTPSVVACPGATVIIETTVTNTGPLPTSFTLFAEGAAWPLTFEPPVTQVLAAGDTAFADLIVTLPAGQPELTSTLVVSARRDLDGGTRGYSVLTVTRVGGRGDLDCDGDCDFFDIDPFVVALAGEAAYQASYPGCHWLHADVNCDGAVDFFDIDPLVAQIGQ